MRLGGTGWLWQVRRRIHACGDHGADVSRGHSRRTKRRGLRMTESVGSSDGFIDAADAGFEVTSAGEGVEFPCGDFREL